MQIILNENPCIMKKIYLPLSLLLVPFIILFLAFTSGPSEGYTGSPLDGNDCSGCHSPGPATIVEDWISTTVPQDGYLPGETYTVTLSTFGQTSDKWGFQITCETLAAKTGTWVITDPARTKIVGSSVTHTSAGTVPSGSPNTWTIDWTAPESGTGMVTFYASVNNTNDDGTNQGDAIYITSRSEPESTIGLQEASLDDIGMLYPNPATDRISIALPVNSSIVIFDHSGRMVRQETARAETLAMDINDLERGVYYMLIDINGQTATRSFIRK